MRSSAHYLRHSLAAAICLALAPMAFAAAPEVSADSESITVGSEAPAYTLRLSYPDGRVGERVLLSGESFAIDAMSPGGQLADGIYQFEAQPITGLRERSGMDADAQVDKSIGASMPSENGSFRVHQGRIVIADTESAKQGDQDFGVRMKDQVISDDLIVNNGSLCVGQDCVNGENFGFDTIRMKENNLRLHFDDTSNSGSFPNNDWTLIANDSSNGGANYFAIEDRTAGRRVFEVRAGAPANSLFVDSSGRVGIKTSTPVVNIHVAEGNSPALRLEQNGSSGFTAQTWDIAGNETNFFVRDVTNGSTLPFKIKPGAPTDSLYIDADGDVGLGTASPAGVVHVNRSGNVIGYLQSSSNDAVQLRFRTNSTNRRFLAVNAADEAQAQIEFQDNGTINFFGPTAAQLNATISNAGLNVNGTISLNGGQIHPDYVFEPSYELLSIDQHAAHMWSAKHLPAVGPGTYNPDGSSRLDIGSKTLGILEELEVAHIYIEQLHKRLKEQQGQLGALEARLQKLETQTNAGLQVTNRPQ